MNFRNLMLAALGLIVLVGSVTPANAQYYRHHHRHHHHHHRYGR